MLKERFVTSFDGTKLYTLSSGEGLPLVLCDGIGCDGFILRFLRPGLQEEFQVVNWHYRGHGRSEVPSNPDALGIDELRQDLIAVLDDLGFERAVLLGFSMGVQLALEAAVCHPDRVLGVVPICGSYGRPLDTFHNNRLVAAAFPYMLRVAQRWPDRARWVWNTAVLSEAFYQIAINIEVEGRLIKREDFQPYFEHLGRMDAMVFLRMLDKVRHHSVEPRLHEIEAPALVIAGERDTFTPVWLSEHMARLIPEAELVVVPWGTHVAPLEMPELIELHVRRFLEERVLPRVQTKKRTRRRAATGQRAKEGARTRKKPRKRQAQGQNAKV